MEEVSRIKSPEIKLNDINKLFLSWMRKNKGPTKAELIRIVAEAALGGSAGLVYLPSFDAKFHIALTMDNKKIILITDNNKETKIISQSDFAGVLLAEVNRISIEIGCYSSFTSMQHKEFISVASTIIYMSKCIKYSVVKSIGEISEKGLYWARLKFEYQYKLYPVIEKNILNKISSKIQKRALMALIGALLDNDAQPEHFVLMHSEIGGQGKGTILKLIDYALGCAATWFSDDDYKDKHWTASIQGKRAILGGDINKLGFIKSGWFKAMTGGDKINYRPMFEKGYADKFNGIFFVSSNYKPDLKNDFAVNRRIIYIQINKENEERDHVEDFTTKVKSEIPSFLSDCKETWSFLKETRNGIIPIDDNELNELSEDSCEEFPGLFEKCFNINKNSCISWHDFRTRITLFNPSMNKRNTYSEFKRWCQFNQLIKKTTRKGVTVCAGVSIKQNSKL